MLFKRSPRRITLTPAGEACLPKLTAAFEQLAQAVAPVTLHHRTDFAASMIDGRTVMEVDAKSRSAQEVVALWSYISDRLEKNFRRTVFATPQMANGHMGSRSAGGFGRRVVGQ